MLYLAKSLGYTFIVKGASVVNKREANVYTDDLLRLLGSAIVKGKYKNFRGKKRYYKKISPTRRAYLAGLRAGKRIARSRRSFRRW